MSQVEIVSGLTADVEEPSDELEDCAFDLITQELDGGDAMDSAEALVRGVMSGLYERGHKEGHAEGYGDAELRYMLQIEALVSAHKTARQHDEIEFQRILTQRAEKAKARETNAYNAGLQAGVLLMSQAPWFKPNPVKEEVKVSQATQFLVLGL